MSAPPGWYPDPGGQPGRLRYWDGRGWSSDAPIRPPAPPQPPARWRWVIGALAVLVALIVVGVLVVRQVSGGALDPRDPIGDPPADACPVHEEDSTAPPRPADGRVHGGALSYPQLGAPWTAPRTDHRVPFGRDVREQYVEIERGPFLDFDSWGANVLVGELAAGDGFFAPKDGAAIVVRCVTGTFYGDTEVTRDDRRSQAITVDGRPGWVMETNLGFEVPNLVAEHELLIVVIVDVGDGTAGLFLASVPENGPQYVAPARRALAELQVDP